jgi:hypothetical protein
MNINNINNSAASWAQFVKLTQAARDRNSGLTAAAAGRAAQTQSAGDVSFKRVADVYSSSIKQTAPNYGVRASPLLNEMNRKTVGGQFDAYA